MPDTCFPQSVPSPLPLEGARNVRELGGYRAGSEVTETRRFLRSDSISALTPEDCALLYDYGVRLVVDLRGEKEISQAPDALAGFRDIAYRGVPLSDHVNDMTAAAGIPSTMGEMYIGLLENCGAELAKIFRHFLACEAGCALFHCTAGKDRTGTVAMLLLKLAGVDDETVVADYAATERNLPPWEVLQAQLSAALGLELPGHLFRSQPEDMRALLAHLKARYGGAAEYLAKIGLTGGETAALRARLLVSR